MRARRSASVLVAVAAGLAACGPSATAPAFKNLGPDAAYIGEAACATCHQDIASAYASHGMANSMERLTPGAIQAPPLADPVIDPHTGFEYRVIETADGLAQEERQIGPDGAEIARIVRPMEWVVGSGHAARTYLAERGDRLVQLPLTYYSQAGRWDFSPGYEASNPRFGRVVPDGCMSCHNAVPERVAGVEDAFASIPEGIGCERCHGPGSLHVEARLASADSVAGPDPTIVNPKWLDIDLRLDVCQQCHLHATVDVLREGETAYSYRPGRPLSAHEGLFAVPGLEAGGEGIAVVSHADRMRASACFTETQRTAAPLECVTCHDPHESFASRGAAALTASCVTCHDLSALGSSVPPDLRAEHQPGASCTSCHMPRVEASNAPHASFTDHWIRVVGRGEAGLPEPEVGRSGIVAPVAEADREGVAGGLYEGIAALTYGTRAADPRALGVGAQFVEIALGRLPEPSAWGEAQFLLGVARLTSGQAAAALSPLQAAIAHDPTPQRLETLARALWDAGRAAEAREAFRRAVAAQPRRPDTRREHGRFLAAQGDAAAALDALDAALALDPWDAEAHLLRGLVLRSMGQAPEAAWREAVRLDPDLAPVLASGRSGAGPLWTAPTVFGWPVASAWDEVRGRADVYSTSGTRLLQGVAPSEIAARLRSAGRAPGLVVVRAAGRSPFRAAVVEPRP